MSFTQPKGTSIQISHSGHVITISLILALAFNLLPWSVDYLWLRPDFLLLVLLFWLIYQPARVGLGAAWALGLLVDLTDGSILGQHALAYAVTTFALMLLQRRMFNFPPWQQTIHIAGLLLIEQSMSVVVATFVGDSFHALQYFSAILTGALCWIPLWTVLHSQRTPDAKNPQ
ncbi:rod shape-determining protein MreD [Sulfuriferula nivalis]|uniref:Rod shape-determining protein MreD n=1 Tax=Sulfuriferula nivalis TaxID=2675298 RepID=A0A809SGC8_9PROT|nr:rod shape-determining protein MreD [Sulfuriferula nivalis]BBO99819.1 rod shape-determining protein MreD [Sulfuriferula nivalis]